MNLVELVLEKVSELNERTEAHCGSAPFSMVANDFEVSIEFHTLQVWTSEDCEYDADTGDLLPIDGALLEQLAELQGELTGAIVGMHKGVSIGGLA